MGNEEQLKDNIEKRVNNVESVMGNLSEQMSSISTMIQSLMKDNKELRKANRQLHDKFENIDFYKSEEEKLNRESALGSTLNESEDEYEVIDPFLTTQNINLMNTVINEILSKDVTINIPSIGWVSINLSSIKTILYLVEKSQNEGLTNLEKVSLIKALLEMKVEASTEIRNIGYGDEEVPIYNPNSVYNIENCVKEIIDQNGMRQNHLAKMVHVSDKNISEILANKGNPSIKTVLHICGLLGLKVDQVYRLIETEE